MNFKKRINVGIMDYGIGNFASLKGALEQLNYKVVRGNKEIDFVNADCVFMPGVGSLPFAMAQIKAAGLDHFIKNRFESQDLKFVGICLGMQLFFEHSEEGDEAGLGLFEGNVKTFSDKGCHVGWNLTHSTDDEKSVKAYYYNHSYYVDCNKKYIKATASYQGERAVIVKDKLFTGVQFHPEKSQRMGLFLLRELVEG